MPPSPQPPEPRPRNLPGVVADELYGPAEGVVEQRYEAKYVKVVKRSTGDEDDFLAFFDSLERGRAVERREGVAA
ncbi:hypothetical protein ACIQI8_28185 [Streptomyces sp. NPDC092369]|uniref:hypothetical protein n=1 Tax=Streptomyces sp. NPDC092369 TaxID=3366015 RepID=UPI0037FD6E77